MITALVTGVLAQCFVIDDATPGWKQITLPASAPQLAAPDAYDQFRTGELAIIRHELPEVLRSSYRSAMGRQTFDLALPPDSRSVTMRFGRPLDGAKVDVVLEGNRGRMALLDERRTSGSELVWKVALPDANRAIVTVHYHLRDTPTLDAATVERHVTPLQAADFPPQLKLENSLYVFNPGGPITLCQRPGQPMVLAATSLQQSRVRSVALTAAK